MGAVLRNVYLYCVRHSDGSVCVCVCMQQTQREDISAAVVVMKSCWTMTRPSQHILESPLFSPPRVLSLNPLLYLDGTLENLIVTQHLTKTKVSGRQLEMTSLTASVRSILKQPLSLSFWTFSLGRGWQHGQISAKTNNIVCVWVQMAWAPINARTH